MRPTASTITTKGGFDGEKIGLSVDSKAMQHIMGILTDLYSDPALAVIREYSTNALDAHREAGNDAPIEVSTPTRMSPYFKVKDYGVGLDADALRNIYSKYGASTKRDTNDQVGMLGVGCKSGLTYTDQLLIESVKDKTKYNAVLARDDSGAASIQIVNIDATDEPNGVEITIPVRDIYEFEAKMTNFFRFWQPGTVLVDGKEPQGFAGMDKITDTLYLNPSSRQDYVVMGNVPYQAKIPTRITRNYRYEFGIVAIVPVGSVDFTPSREQLHMTPRTEKQLASVAKAFDAALRQKINDEIAGAKTAKEAMEKGWTWQSKVEGVKPEWKGKVIPYQWSLRVKNPTPFASDAETYGREFNLNTDTLLDYTWAVGSKAGFSYTHLTYRSPKDSVIVTGFDIKRFTTLHIRKIRLYLEKMGVVNAPDPTQAKIGTNIGVFVSRNDDVTEDGWLDDFFTIIKWEDVRTMKLPKATNSGPKADYFIHTANTAANAVIDKTKPLYYKTAGIGETKLVKKDWLFANILEPDAQVAVMSGLRVDKFKRLYPSAVEITQQVAKKAREYEAKLPQSVLDRLSRDRVHLHPAFGAIRDHTKVLDPELATEIKLNINKYDVEYDKFTAMRSIFSYFGVPLLTNTNRADSKVVEKLNRRYPLVNSISYASDGASMLEYVNALYTIRNGKGN